MPELREEQIPLTWPLQRELEPLPTVLSMTWDGEPVSKSRARFTGYGSKVRTYTPEKTRTAEVRIVALARAEGIRGPADGTSTFGVHAKFLCGGWQRRDVDNMLKLVADALTGIVWVDDSQVSEMSASVERGVGATEARTHLLIYRTTAATHPSAPCVNCGTTVKHYKSSAPAYCSDDCRLAVRRLARIRICEHCGLTFDPGKPSEAKYCSANCRQLASRAEHACAQCGVTFHRQRCFVRAVYLCSPDCAEAYRQQQTVKTPKGHCQECGGAVSRREYARCRKCSLAGSGINGAPVVGARAVDNRDVIQPYTTPAGRLVATELP